ncbi:MAG: rane protein AbrB duplication [Paenibacillaceae bacterium]|jgi:membrane AbrB-like protein|nr:rane protein AbrB duplication [Paenibacillaceae bacterium]
MNHATKKTARKAAKKTWVNVQVGKTLLLALAGGFGFQLLHIPLAWMLGPMTVLLIWREALGRSAEWPRAYREGGLVVLGYMMGLTFTSAVALQILDLLPSMAAATLMTVGFGLIAGWVTVKRTGISMASGLLGSVPGGLSQMTTLCDEVENADMTVVTFMQTIRVMAVIFIVPFLAFHGLAGNGEGKPSVPGKAAETAMVVQTHTAGAKPVAAGLSGGAAEASTDSKSAAGSTKPTAGGDAAGTIGGKDHSGGRSPWLQWNALWYVLGAAAMVWIAPKLHLPTPYMLGSMLGAAVLTCSGLTGPELPQWCIIGAQITIGTYMGVSTSLSALSNWRKLLPYAIFGAVGIVLFSLGVGYVLTLWHPMTLVTGFLGSAPGGMTEMGLTGVAVGADVSIIVGYQMFRLLFILFLSPYLVKWLLRFYHAHSRADAPVKGY